MGELGDLNAAPTLIAYLGNLHGSALGGFHLPAMGALEARPRRGPRPWSASPPGPSRSPA
ncbi:MAG: hypothetical protein IPI35_11660 [Deltaproteobacteria bacterium]|nr:hypothetical protein [Deltaproteobacteria bacterium]